MPALTEYGDLLLNTCLDEWGRRRIDGGVLEDGVKIIGITGVILKQWSQTVFVNHVFSRPSRFMKLTQNLNIAHVFGRPFRLIRLSQTVQLTHVLRRPFRLIRLSQTLQLTHALRRNRLIRFLTQILTPLHNWVKRVLGGFPFKIAVEERQPVNVSAETIEHVQLTVTERKPVQILWEEQAG